MNGSESQADEPTAPSPRDARAPGRRVGALPGADLRRGVHRDRWLVRPAASPGMATSSPPTMTARSASSSATARTAADHRPISTLSRCATGRFRVGSRSRAARAEQHDVPSPRPAHEAKLRRCASALTASLKLERLGRIQRSDRLLVSPADLHTGCAAHIGALQIMGCLADELLHLLEPRDHEPDIPNCLVQSGLPLAALYGIPRHQELSVGCLRTSSSWNLSSSCWRLMNLVQPVPVAFGRGALAGLGAG